MPFMGSGRPPAAGASSPVILSAAKHPSPIVHPFQVLPHPRRRDEHLCPSWVSLIRFAQQTIVCVSRRSSRVRYIKRVRRAHHLIRHGCAVPPSPQGEGFGFASGKLRSFRSPGRSPLRVRASPTGDGAWTARCCPYGGTWTAGCRPYGGTGRQIARATGKWPALHKEDGSVSCCTRHGAVFLMFFILCPGASRAPLPGCRPPGGQG